MKVSIKSLAITELQASFQEDLEDIKTE